MTEALFREDAYRAETEAIVLMSEPRGIALDRTVFYPQGGGQSGDQGALMLEDGLAIPIVNTVYDSDRKTILHVPAEGVALPRPGARVTARINWALRHQRMRAHTALHLLSVVAPYPVTGGSVGDAEGRLDFDLGEAVLDKTEVERRLNELIALDRGGHPSLDRRRGARSQSWLDQDHGGQAADGDRPSPPDRDRGPRSSALRGNAC